MNNKQTILNLTEAALQNGGNIKISFYLDTKDEAEKMARKFSHIAEEQYKQDSYDGANWFKVENWKKGIEVTIYFRETKGYMIEDVEFGGDGIAI